MPPELIALFDAQGGVATFAQICDHLSRRSLQQLLRCEALVKVWPGIYSIGEPDQQTRLAGLDLQCGEPVAMCLGSAAAAYGFDTEDVTKLHVLHPEGTRLRDTPGLVVHRRDGAPLTTVEGRPMTESAWTAVEVARSLRRPRALATLDMALRNTALTREELMQAAQAQKGRRGIVHVRNLIPLANPLAESPMESESRLVMHDGGIPEPTLQYEIIDVDGELWRLDFAWPDVKVAVEYDGFDWHSSKDHLRRDRRKRAALLEMEWTVLYIVAVDVRANRHQFLRRLESVLERAAAAA
jgi:hypothetical protein